MMIDRAFTHLRYEVRNAVAHVVLNRPDRRNSLGLGEGSSRDEIMRAMREAEQDVEVGCILVSAEGNSFCAGGDISHLPPAALPIDDKYMIDQIDTFHATVRSIAKPVIAAVQGYCLGAGLGFLVQCDFAVASADAKFGLPEGRFGHPGGVELVGVVAASWTKFMIFTGEMLDAQQAVDCGLALVVVPRHRLLDATTELAERIARMPSVALQLNKASIDAAIDASGRVAGRLAGRAVDVLTKSMSRYAQAPDGRSFEDIHAHEGLDGLKKAQEDQYIGSWLSSIRN